MVKLGFLKMKTLSWVITLRQPIIWGLILINICHDIWNLILIPNILIRRPSLLFIHFELLFSNSFKNIPENSFQSTSYLSSTNTDGSFILSCHYIVWLKCVVLFYKKGRCVLQTPGFSFIIFKPTNIWLLVSFPFIS